MSQRLNAIVHLLFTALIFTGAFSSCKDDPVTPPGSKDSCDTCICDTCDTTDTLVVTPSDTTSHDFLWTEYSIPGEASITGCWVFDDTTIWAVSNKLYQLKNKNWEVIHDFNSGTSLFAFSPNDAWFIYYEIIWRWKNGVREEIRLKNAPYNLWDPATDGAFRAAWGTSSNDMFFVGDKGTIVHFDGTNWMKFPKLTEKNLQSVWGTSHNDIYACGFDLSTAGTILLHFDGSSWSEVDISIQKGIYATGGFNTVWTVDSASHKIVLTGGALLIRRTDSEPWRSDSGKVTNRLGDGSFAPLYTIRGNSSNDFMLAGAGGWIGHWNGRSWHQYTALFNYDNFSYDTGPMSMKGNTVVFAGKKSGQGFVAIGRRAK